MVTTEHFSRLVQNIYDAAIDPDCWEVALDGIASAVDATGCALLTSSRAHNEITTKSVGADPASMIAYNDYYCRLDPCPRGLERMAPGAVGPRQQLVSPERVTRCREFYHDWAHPNDYGDGIFSVLTRNEEGATWLTAAASLRADPYGTPERLSLVRALVPHMQQAIRVQSRLTDLDRRCHDIVVAFNLLTDGVLIVGRDRRVLHLNSAAEAMVQQDDGLCVRSGYFKAAVASVDRVLDGIVNRAVADRHSTAAPGGYLTIPRPDGARPYVVRVIPTYAYAVDTSPTALVIVVDPEQEFMPDGEAVRRLYGLTKTEAEIAIRVLDGTGLIPIAEELSISLSTARTHLQHIFDKTNTHRQAELVRLLLRGLAGTRN
jgi:DNA-binding CsgD family transcriptional regulator/PAS domain-containing protein